MNIISISELQKIDDRTLYEYCQYVGGQARIWKNHFVALLPEVAKRGIHKTHGFATIVEFAAKVGGVGRKTVETVFQVENLVSDKPALKNLVPEIGVNKIRIVATIATQENQNILAKKAREMSKGALEVWTREVKILLKKGFLNEKFENIQNNKGRQNTGESEKIQQFFAENNPSLSQSPPGRSKREQISFGLDEAVSFKLRLFKHQLEKQKKIALEWNDVIDDLLKRANGY